MDYFNGLIDFKTDADGEIIYFPNSFLGKGFIVPSIEKKNEIQKAAKRIWRIFFFICVLAVIGFSISSVLSSDIWRWIFRICFLVIMIGLAVWARRSINSLAKGLAESSVKISIFERQTNMALSMSFIFLLLLEVGSGCFVFTGFQMAKNPQFSPWFYRPAGILTVIFFGFACIVFAYMIILKIKKIFTE